MSPSRIPPEPSVNHLMQLSHFSSSSVLAALPPFVHSNSPILLVDCDSFVHLEIIISGIHECRFLRTAHVDLLNVCSASQ